MLKSGLKILGVYLIVLGVSNGSFLLFHAVDLIVGSVVEPLTATLAGIVSACIFIISGVLLCIKTDLVCSWMNSDVMSETEVEDASGIILLRVLGIYFVLLYVGSFVRTVILAFSSTSEFMDKISLLGPVVIPVLLALVLIVKADDIWRRMART